MGSQLQGLAVCRRGSLVPCGRCSGRAQGAMLREFSDRLLGPALPCRFGFKFSRSIPTEFWKDTGEDAYAGDYRARRVICQILYHLGNDSIT